MRIPDSTRRLTAILLGIAVIGTGYGHEDDHEEAYRLRERREILPLEDLLGLAGLSPETRILEIEYEPKDDRRLYEIEYLDEAGRIREIRIDTDTGQVLDHGEH